MALGRLLPLLRLLCLSVFILRTKALVAAAGPSRLLSFSLQPDTRPPSTSITKRADQDIQLYGDSSSIRYFIQLNIGTPSQAVRVAVDTGDFNLWVNANCTRQWVSDAQLCRSGGIYNPDKSTSSEEMDLQLTTEYYDNSSVTMNFFTDTVTLSTGLRVDDLEFGVAAGGSGITQGILGLGYGEAAGTTTYLTFVDQLASQGVTNSKAFSLALGNETGNSGVIIFGGIDTQKFGGTLTSVDIVPEPDSSYSSGMYYVELTSVGIDGGGDQPTTYAESDATVAIVTDSTFSYLPKAIATALNSDVGNGTDCVEGFIGPGCAYMVQCSQIQNDTRNVDFAFHDATISVPLSSLVGDNGYGTCFLGVGGLDDDDLWAATLGLNFLRSAYVVFDQTLSKVSLGQYVNCGSNEQEMPSSGAASFKGECELPDSLSTTSPSTSSGTPSSASSSSGGRSSGLSTGAKAGIGVGVGLGAMVAAGLLCFLVLSRRRGRKATWNGGEASYTAAEQSPSPGPGPGPGPHELAGGQASLKLAPAMSKPGSPTSPQFLFSKEEHVGDHHVHEMEAASPVTTHIAELATD